MNEMARYGFTFARASFAMAVVGFALLVLPLAATAAGPTCSNHEFYGTVTSGGHVVGAGYVVTAMVNGQQVATGTTDAQGRWGSDQSFAVTCPPGSLIEFYVNGELIGSAASCIETNELNLAVSRPPQASNTQALQAPQTATSSDTSSSSAQPSTTSDSAGAITSPATVTFLIGQQSNSTAGQPVARINCTLPGKTTDLTLRGGVLMAATRLQSDGGDIELDVAASTAIGLDNGRQITVTRLLAPPAPPAGSSLIAAYSLEPEGTTFNPPATLKLKFNPQTLPSGITVPNLYLAQLTDSGDWKSLPSSVDTNAGSVGMELAHFSAYALLGRLPEQLTPAVEPPAVTKESVTSTGTSRAEQPSTESQPPAAVERPQPSNPGMDIFVPAVLVAGIILMVILLVAIFRKKSAY